MSVQLSPSSQLGFQRPLTTLVKRTLSVSNHNSHAIAYKVKTTAPKQYCVRPNSGRIEPGETVEVQVLLQPMKDDPPAGTKCRDKFLVQSVVITPERENVPLAELWAVVDKDKDKDATDGGLNQIHEQKIRCTYLPAADEPVHQAIPEEQHQSKLADTTLNPDSSFVSTINTGASTTPPPPPSAPAPSSAAAAASSGAPPTLGGELDKAATRTTATETSYVEQAKDRAGSAAAVASASIAAAATTAASGLSNVAQSIDPTKSSSSSTARSGSGSAGAGGEENERLKRELSSALSEISQLKSQLASSSSSGGGLRQRGTTTTTTNANSDETSSSISSSAAAGSKVVEMRGAEGVPVQTVAAIAFAVFLFTW
ncbi:hypothetical protein JCM3766R1_002597 [Sporobolomyces carnicolor]